MHYCNCLSELYQVLVGLDHDVDGVLDMKMQMSLEKVEYFCSYSVASICFGWVLLNSFTLNGRTSIKIVMQGVT